MNRSKHRTRLARLLLVALSCSLSFSTFQAVSEDIDIFSVDVDETANKPNVLIVLDNSANWSRQSQQWPGGLTQGESEVRAIRDVIIGTPSLPPSDPDYLPGLPNNSINVGVLEFITGGSAADQDSGFVRMHIRPMTDGTGGTANNKAILAGHMDTIFNNINDPEEKRPQSNPFGNLFWDVYNYLAGTNHSNGGAGTLDSKSDDDGYNPKHTVFRSPLTATDSCTRTVVIFIGNNVQNGPTPDSAANQTALQDLGGETAQIRFANYAVTSTPRQSPAGYLSTACYTDAQVAACTTAESSTPACAAAGFTSCDCNPDLSLSQSCVTLNKFQIWGRATSTGAPTESSTATLGAATGEATKCQNNNPGAYTCPSSSTTPPTTTDGPGPDETTTTTTTTSWSGCSYVEQTNACGASDNKSLWTPRGTKTVTTTSTVSTLATSAEITDAKSTCRTDAMSCTALDFPATCSDGTYQQCRCDTPIFAECGGAGTQRYQVRGNYTETTAKITDGDRPAPTGPFMADEWARFLSERGVPLPGAVAPPGGEVPRTQVTTYAIDVFNAQQHPDFSGLLFNIAHVGGGKYFQAKNENQLRDALLKIFSEVQSVNSAFSSASLPVNATNRAQNENQVFIGVFRPDRTKEPQWFGNLKRYQLVANGTRIDLGDSNGATAINPLTGFLAECAVSFWTTASGTYWQSVITDNPPAVSNCGAVANSAHSDLPDGPYVEKGAVAEVLRKGNDPNATPGGDGNYVLSRNMKTRTAATAAGELLPNFSFPVSTLPDIDRDADADVDADDATLKTTRATLIENFIKGQDRNDDDLDGGATTTGRTEPRSTIHGDVIHSRPQPVNYGDADGNPANGINPGVVIYYGANDGTFRAVKAATGQELWSFVAPEHFGKFDRYTSNAPNIKYFDPEGDDPPGTEPKDYFFDGSTGVRQTANNSQVWIFPTMRRGGRRIYAFDVTSTSAPMLPRYLWSKGFGDTGFEDMGQTWSVPNVGFIAGYSSGTRPVVVVGGGYDSNCDDKPRVPTAADCAGAAGKGVYVIDAEDGSLRRHFDFSGISGARSVVADVALVDTNGDTRIDHAYAVDTGGSVYRMSFVNASGAPLAEADWSFTRIARTTGGGRKFLFTPALFQAGSKLVYVAVGSGDREAPLISQYPYNNFDGNPLTNDGGVTNRFYLFKDDLTGATAEINLDTVGTSNMQDYTTEPAGCPAAHNPPTLVCPQPILPGDPVGNPSGYAAAAKGWFINLNANGQGEQVVTSAVISAGFLIFSTNRPTLPSGDACVNSLGEARGYFLNLFNASGAIGVAGAEGGDRSSVFVGGGLPPSPVVAVVPIGDSLEPVVIGAVQKDGTASSPIGSQRLRPPIKSYRTPVYWYKSGDTDTE